MKQKVVLWIIGSITVMGFIALLTLKTARPIERGLDQQGITAVDLSDDRNLVGACHFVFVGKIISEGEWRQLDIFKLRQYSVDVILNIKGNLRGGIEAYGHEFNPGSTYVICAHWNLNNWKLLTISDIEKKLLSSDATLTTEQLKDLAERNERVIALKYAYPREIIKGGDPATFWNNYQSVKSGHPLIPPPFAGDVTTAPAPQSLPPTAPASELESSVSPEPSVTETVAPSTSSAPTPSMSESVAPSASVEPVASPTITLPAESASPLPSPTVEPTPTPTVETPAPTPLLEESQVPTPSPTEALVQF